MNEIDGQIERTREALAGLRARAESTGSAPLAEAIEELSNTLEELEVASEELLEQNDELRATQDQLATQRRAYQELFDFAPNAYLVTNTHGIIREVNREGARLLGDTQGRLVGRPFVTFVASRGRSSFRRQLNRLASQRAHGWEIAMDVRGRSEMTVWADVEPAHDGAGQVHELRWMLRDVTSTKRARILLQERFAASAREAERLIDLDRWKDALLAAAAHDLRAPLVMIDAAAQEILRSADAEPGQARDRAEWIRGCVDHMDQLLMDLLDLDRFTRGAVVPDCQPTDVRALVERVVDRTAVGDHPLNVSVERAWASLDAPRVEQLLGNLLRNAVTHTPARTPISVSVDVVDDQVIIVVEDEGPGIPAEIRESLFSPFVTTSAHAADPGGTGIGLSLVQLFAELHGGTVSVDAGARGGARFVVVLPGGVGQGSAAAGATGRGEGAPDRTFR